MTIFGAKKRPARLTLLYWPRFLMAVSTWHTALLREPRSRATLLPCSRAALYVGLRTYPQHLLNPGYGFRA